MEPQSKGAGGRRAGASPGRGGLCNAVDPKLRLPRLALLPLGERKWVNPARGVRGEPEGQGSSVVWSGGGSAPSVHPQANPLTAVTAIILVRYLGSSSVNSRPAFKMEHARNQGPGPLPQQSLI